MGEGYLYTILDKRNRKINTTTRLDVVTRWRSELTKCNPDQGPFSIKADHLDSDSGYVLLNTDDEIEEFREARVRNKQWSSGKAMKAEIEEWEQSQINKWMSEQTPQKTEIQPVDGNLKTLAALSKPKISDVPPVALFAIGGAMSDGATKYGRYNWRATGTTASVFYDAMMRHLVDWYNGEEYAHDSGIHHLAHLMASCAIILDSQAQGCFNDDRYKVDCSVTRSPKLWRK